MTRALNILGWIGTALVFAAVAVRLLGWAGSINVSEQIGTYAVYAAWSGLALVLLYTIGQWREIGAYFTRRQARYGTLASLSVVIVLGILVTVNYLSTRQNKRWDLTANQQFTLSDQTVKLLQGLTSPVKFLVFDQEVNFERFKTRLTEYQYNSKQVQVEYIDADKRPVQTRQYQVQSYGTVVVEYMGRTERITTDTEQDLTNALIKVLTPSKKKVYFLAGHGEKDTGATERMGYSGIADALKRDNYEFDKLVLAQQQDVPADASVVAIAGPRADLLQPEGTMLERYLEKGGHLLVLLDPPEGDTATLPVLDGLLKAWSIDVGNNVVVDVSGMGQLLGTDASVPVAATYPQHPITERFNVLTAYPLARSVAPATSATEGRAAQTIIETGPRSWAESDVKQLRASGKVEMNAAAGDKPGPVSIGVAVTAPIKEAAKPAAETANAAKQAESKPESRVVAIGDSDFGANYAIGIQGNRDLFMNTVNWLAQQESLIAIRPREAADRRITVTASQMNGMLLLSLVIVPGAVLGAGIYTWWRRR